MSRLLHISASPRGDRSGSLAVAAAFIDAWRAANPGATVETLDVWQARLPAFNGTLLDAKYAVLHGVAQDDAQVAAWRQVVETADHFKSFDRYVISTPMWNFGIPYALKHYIDVLSQPGQTFGWTPEQGYFGLVTGKRALLVHSSAGAYGAGSGAEAIDFQKPYLEWILKFVGITEQHAIACAPTAAAPDEVARTLAAAKAAAVELAGRF